jgi:hypothetical protein
MKHRRKTPPRIPIEEFSIEYGDVNGKPLIDVKKGRNKTRLKAEK